MTHDQLALLGDTRLPSAARLIGFLISQHPEEGLQATKLELSAILGPSEAASDDTIGRHLKRLESTGWIRRESGGRGHGDTYHLIPAHECGAKSPTAAIRSAMGAALSDSSGTGADVSGDRSGTGAALSDPVVVVGEDVVVGGVGAREAGGHDLDTLAESILEESDTLEGCRGALSDYLRARVPTDRQHAYIRTVEAWIDGGSGSPKGLLALDDPTHLLAVALNDLGTEDETQFRAARGQIGVTSTLRSKVEYLVRQEKGRGGDVAYADVDPWEETA